MTVEQECEQILTRLRNGERLIAFSAAGVQWSIGDRVPFGPADLPDPDALAWLVQTKAIVESTAMVPIIGKVKVALFELALNEESNNAR